MKALGYLLAVIIGAAAALVAIQQNTRWRFSDGHSQPPLSLSGLNNASAASGSGSSASTKTRLTILSTNDLHAQVEGCCSEQFHHKRSGQGGFAKLAAKLQEERRAAEEAGRAVLLIDAGDWHSGSLFHLLGPSAHASAAGSSPELDFFAYMDYDMVVIGNHDFDSGEEGLKRMITKLKEKRSDLPMFSSNMEEGDLLDLLGAQRYKIVVKGGARVGLLSITGPDAAMHSQMNRNTTTFIGYNDRERKVEWDALVQHTQRLVTTLREHEHCDLVAIGLHGGFPEDLRLLRAVDGVDILVAGHTHEVYYHLEVAPEAIEQRPSGHKMTMSDGLDSGEHTVKDRTNDEHEDSLQEDTRSEAHSESQISSGEAKFDFDVKDEPATSVRHMHMLQCGHSGLMYGKLELGLRQDGAWHLESQGAKCKTIEGVLTEDEYIRNCTKRWKEEIDQIIAPFRYDQILVDEPTSTFPLSPGRLEDMAPQVLGLLLRGLNQHKHKLLKKQNTEVDKTSELKSKTLSIAELGRQGGDVDLYLHCPHCLRGEIRSVESRVVLQFSDVYRFFSMTFDSPILEFYIQKSHLRAVLDGILLLQTFVSDLYAISISDNLEYSINEGWLSIPFYNRVQNLSMNGVPYEEWPDLILVATNSYIARYFWFLPGHIDWILPHVPRDCNGDPLTFEQAMKMSADAGQSFEVELFVETFAAQGEKDQA